MGLENENTLYIYIYKKMSKNLVIVESPAKAKTIEQFLGKDFKVLSSQGHIRDIEGHGKDNMGIDFEHNYEPNYVIDPTKQNLIATLRAEAQKADTVWLASDEDREGEAIAWHLKDVLNLDDKKTKRIVFHEITKTAIQNAILNPRDIDYNLVNAQQARRVMDRIVGFDLSPVLWKKITTGLSAGRVQSVAVRLVVEREREINEYKPTYAYHIFAEFTGSNPGDASILRAKLDKNFVTKKAAIEFLEQLPKSQFKVQSIVKKPVNHTPAPPFTTSTLQQEAARKLKFPVSKTMRLAQSLYEAGKITYMRTDSVNLSSLAIATAKEEIIKLYGENYHRARQYHTTAKGAQEAHEAIRPTYMSVHNAGATADEQKLYELIWKRTIACQMADAQVEKTDISISSIVNSQSSIFSASGEVLVFDGFMRAYVQSSDESDTRHQTPDTTLQTLPAMAVDERLRLRCAVAQQTFKKAPSRYNEATLVKSMEDLGIGRPSTYATIIETILQRKYVERGSVAGSKQNYNVITLYGTKITEKTKSSIVNNQSSILLPTDLGILTNDFLVEAFPDILNYDFTAKSEASFDAIAEGAGDWVQTVDSFYRRFHPLVSGIQGGKIEGREVGIDPVSGRTIVAKISKAGPCVLMEDPEGGKPTFASLNKGQSIFTISLKEALELFAANEPKTLMVDGQRVIVGEGKYGPYIRFNGQYISIPKGINIDTLSELDVRTLVAEQAAKSEPIHDWKTIQVLNGRYGAYIKTKDGNYKLPKGTDVASLTKEDCENIIAAASSAPISTKKHYFRKKK